MDDLLEAGRGRSTLRHCARQVHKVPLSQPHKVPLSQPHEARQPGKLGQPGVNATTALQQLLPERNQWFVRQAAHEAAEQAALRKQRHKLGEALRPQRCSSERSLRRHQCQGRGTVPLEAEERRRARKILGPEDVLDDVSKEPEAVLFAASDKSQAHCSQKVRPGDIAVGLQPVGSRDIASFCHLGGSPLVGKQDAHQGPLLWVLLRPARLHSARPAPEALRLRQHVEGPLGVCADLVGDGCREHALGLSHKLLVLRPSWCLPPLAQRKLCGGGGGRGQPALLQPPASEPAEALGLLLVLCGAPG
mmetsp:Transcript_91711/g.296741  ORF Transcript_91711/g.296741 Transcript_91711/m.296741 type:complete len:305 (-) Transcript_91711:3991-4905(-)